MNVFWVDHYLAPLTERACLCCGMDSDTGELCAGCTEELPWNICACPRCAQPQNHSHFCAQCLTRPPAFDSAWTPFILDGPIQRGIHRFKYAAQFHQGRWLTELMSQQLKKRLAENPGSNPEFLVPVPTSRKKLVLRGFDQVLEIGKKLSSTLDLDMRTDMVSMLREPEEQIGQKAELRRRNLSGAFSANADLNGKRIAILDDVMTTGATLESLAKTLKQCGAIQVEAWALARTP